MMGTILLTGAQGFTGQHFHRAAQQAGWSIHALQADLTDAPAVEQEVLALAPDHVVHLGAVSAVTHRDEQAFYRVNVLGTLNLLNSLVKSNKPPQRILLASSANIYGNTTASPIKETACPRPVNHYATSKLAMEYRALTFAARLPLIIVRPFNYTGVGQDQRFIVPKLVAHFVNKAPFITLGNCAVEREFNDVRTVCAIYLQLLVRGKPAEIYNICSGHALSIDALLTLLQDLTGHSLEVQTDAALVRVNEIPCLYGSPEKLEACIGKIVHPPIAETLQQMLDKA